MTIVIDTFNPIGFEQPTRDLTMATLLSGPILQRERERESTYLALTMAEYWISMTDGQTRKGASAASIQVTDTSPREPGNTHIQMHTLNQFRG